MAAPAPAAAAPGVGASAAAVDGDIPLPTDDEHVAHHVTIVTENDMMTDAEEEEATVDFAKDNKRMQRALPNLRQTAAGRAAVAYTRSQFRARRQGSTADSIASSSEGSGIHSEAEEDEVGAPTTARRVAELEAQCAKYTRITPCLPRFTNSQMETVHLTLDWASRRCGRM